MSLQQIPQPTPNDVCLVYRLREHSNGKQRGMYTRILSRTCEQWPEVIHATFQEFQERGLHKQAKQFIRVFRYTNTFELTKRKIGL